MTRANVVKERIHLLFAGLMVMDPAPGSLPAEYRQIFYRNAVQPRLLLEAGAETLLPRTKLLDLSQETCVGELPMQDFRVDVSVETRQVDHRFRSTPDLAGVIVEDDHRFSGFISRRKFYEIMGRQFGVALYLHRPIQVMLEAVQPDGLMVPHTTPIVDAVRIALARRADQIYEPLLIEFDLGRYSLLDVYTLLLAETRLFAALQHAVQKTNQELEKRVEARTAELVQANVHLQSEIHERRRAETQLEVRLRYEKALNLCAAALLTSGASHGIIQQTITYLIEVVGTSRVFVLENVDIDGLGLCLRLRNQVHADGITPIAETLSVIPHNHMGTWQAALWSGRYVIGQVACAPAEECALMRQIGVRSILLIPIGEPGNWFGVIGFAETEAVRNWDSIEVELLQTVAQMLYAFFERRRYLREVRQAHDQALQASAFKGELLAKVSHELRTPLGAVLGYAQLLYYGSYGELSADQKEAAEVVIGSTKYLANLVNGILDQAQLENGQLTLAWQPFNIRQMADEVQTRIRVLAESKGLAFEVVFGAEVPEEMTGDQVRVEQVLTNLLGNAVKFTETGRVSMRFERLNSDYLAVMIVDTGEGIPEEAQQRIFEPFMQVDGSATRRTGGTGLGLSISRQLIDRMGGRIRLESAVGQGSTFTVELPIHGLQK